MDRNGMICAQIAFSRFAISVCQPTHTERVVQSSYLSTLNTHTFDGPFSGTTQVS